MFYNHLPHAGGKLANMLRAASILLLLALLPMPGGAAEPGFAVDGVSLGDTLSLTKASMLCPAAVAANPDKLCRQTWQLAGLPVLRIMEVRNHRLIGVSMSFPPAAYEALVNRYTQEIGIPSRRWDESIRTRDGHDVVNQLARWRTPQGELLIQRYGSFAARGFAQIRLSGAMLTGAP